MPQESIGTALCFLLSYCLYILSLFPPKKKRKWGYIFQQVVCFLYKKCYRIFLMDTRKDEDLRAENNYLKQSMQFQHELHEIDEDLDEIKDEMHSIERKMSTLSSLLIVLMAALFIFFVALFINGMIIHYDTGLNEINNEVFEE